MEVYEERQYTNGIIEEQEIDEIDTDQQRLWNWYKTNNYIIIKGKSIDNNWRNTCEIIEPNYYKKTIRNILAHKLQGIPELIELIIERLYPPKKG